MSIRSFLFTSVVIGLFATVLSAIPHLPAHTWVSGANGNDTNPGTRALPFATFQAAVNGTAAGGLVSVADPGDFGPITIGKAITIDGGGVGGNLTFTGGFGILISAGASDTVVLRHLTINGVGQGTDGVYFNSGGVLLVQDCAVEGFTQNGIETVASGPQNVVVKNTSISGGVGGFVTDPFGAGPVQASLQDVTISNASMVAVLVQTGVTTISDSVITQSGIGLQSSDSSTINAESCIFSYNTTAVLASTGSTIRLSNNDIFNNGTGIGAGGGTVATAGNNKKAGNPGTGQPVGAPNATIGLQ
ncbi:MAG: right-handed parallel beta-helix repeat-containing protein [Bryobacteraceae bacterium]|jgi:hypothetical protein